MVYQSIRGIEGGRPEGFRRLAQAPVAQLEQYRRYLGGGGAQPNLVESVRGLRPSVSTYSRAAIPDFRAGAPEVEPEGPQWIEPERKSSILPDVELGPAAKQGALDLPSRRELEDGDLSTQILRKVLLGMIDESQNGNRSTPDKRPQRVTDGRNQGLTALSRQDRGRSRNLIDARSATGKASIAEARRILRSGTNGSW